MNSQDRQEVATMIKQAGNRSQFGVTPVPVHFHNGVDSPVIKSPITSYVGYVGSDGSPGVIFPKGWSIIFTNVGGVQPNYTIIHNLGNPNYSIFFTSYAKAYIPILYSLDDVGSPDYITGTKNQISMQWYDPVGAALAQNSFQFAIIVGSTSNNTI